MLTNPGTPFDQDGWSDALNDIRKLNLRVFGETNDLNADAATVSQVQNDGSESDSESGVTLEEADARYLQIGNDLSDVSSAATAKGNLGLALQSCHYYNGTSTAQSIADSTNTPITIFNTAFNGGSLSGFDPTTGVFTAPYAGLYLVTATIVILPNTGTDESAGMFIQDNNGKYSIQSLYSTVSVSLTISVAWNTYLAAGGTLTFYAFATGSSTPHTILGIPSDTMSIVYIGAPY